MKDSLDHFAQAGFQNGSASYIALPLRIPKNWKFPKTFIILPLNGFSEVSENLMDFLVEKMHENNLLHTFAHPILTRKTYSFQFSSILVKYVIKKLPEMGNPGKRSQLYLLLFSMRNDDLNCSYTYDAII